MGAAVRVHAHEDGRPRRLARHHVEAEVADVGPPLVVDDHVVAVAGRQLFEARELDQVAAAGVLLAEQAAVAHRHGQQAPVRRPAQARGAAGDLGDRLHAAVQVDREDRAQGLVREPEPALVPARGLGEAQLDRQARGLHPLSTSPAGAV